MYHHRQSAATMRRVAASAEHPHLQSMLRFEGAALLAEVIAMLWLIVALVGFSIRRSTPWLIGAAFAALVLLSTVIVIADAATA
jgi:hypothetical protein